MTPSLRPGLRALSKSAELLFFPSFCKLCSSLLELAEESVICRDCLQSLIPGRGSFCLCCGRFFEGHGEPHLCQRCEEKRPAYSCHRSCGLYQGKLKDAILLYKYRKYKVLGKALARWAHKILGSDPRLWWGADALVPVPLHAKRRRQRGFNQAEVIAEELARLKGIELVSHCLIKKRNVPPQTSLAAEERQMNVKGTFSLKKPARIKGKVVVLVDDVFTTGATVQECSKVLREAGVREVRGLTLAQA